VSWDVVVAVDIGTWNLLGECVEGPTAKTADRPVAARVCKSPWLVTFLETDDGRLAIAATMEPPVTASRNQRLKIPDDGLGRCRDAAQPPDPINRRKKKRKNY
jgi:hypothetical protein